LTVLEEGKSATVDGTWSEFKVTYTGMINIGANMTFLDPETKVVIEWNPDFLLASAW